MHVLAGSYSVVAITKRITGMSAKGEKLKKREKRQRRRRRNKKILAAYSAAYCGLTTEAKKKRGPQFSRSKLKDQELPSWMVKAIPFVDATNLTPIRLPMGPL